MIGSKSRHFWTNSIFILIILLTFQNFKKYKDFHSLILFSSVGVINLIILCILRSCGGNNMGGWYDVTWRILLLITFILFLDKFFVYSKKNRKIFYFISILISLIVILTPRENFRIRFWKSTVDKSYFENIEKICLDIKNKTNSYDVLGIDDLPGRFTYYSDRNIVSLDGCANSPEYVRKYLRKSRVTNFIKEKIDYVIILRKNVLDIPRNTKKICAKLGFPFNENLKLSDWCFEYKDIISKYPRFSAMLVRVKKNKIYNKFN